MPPGPGTCPHWPGRRAWRPGPIADRKKRFGPNHDHDNLGLTETEGTMARICLINPRFPTSFWGLNHGLPLLGKKANMPVLALPVLAGLTLPGA